jgi:hypothetical protein
MKCCCASNNVSGILKSVAIQARDEEFVKRVAILTLMGLEHIDHTCRNKIGSNINLNLPNAVGRLKIGWKQLIWMVRHGLKHKNTDSNIRATKLQSRIRNVMYQK